MIFIWFDGIRQPNTLYVASVSRGKDSTAMLRAIQLMGWPLDMIASVDIWATDDIPAELPPMVAFKDEWDTKCLDWFGVPVTRLCAMRKVPNSQTVNVESEHGTADNSSSPLYEKVTYEKLFYHIPKRRSQKVQVERERETEAANITDSHKSRGTGALHSKWKHSDKWKPNTPYPSEAINGFPGATNWCNSGLKRSAFQGREKMVASNESRLQGFPPRCGAWCHKLKLDVLDNHDRVFNGGGKWQPHTPYPDGAIKGFPLGNGHLTWCNSLKREPVRQMECQDWISGKTQELVQQPAQSRSARQTFSTQPQNEGQKINIVHYIGIAADEPIRIARHMKDPKKILPLVQIGWDEDLCGLEATYMDMLSPTYEGSCRDGCWFCHNQGIAQLRSLRKNYPDLWALLMKWDNDSPVSFHADGHTVHDFDRRFKLEDEGMIPIDKKFKWSMLDDELNYSLF